MTTHCELTHVLAFKNIFLTQLVTINMTSRPDQIGLTKILEDKDLAKSLEKKNPSELVDFLYDQVSRQMRIGGLHLIVRTGFR